MKPKVTKTTRMMSTPKVAVKKTTYSKSMKSGKGKKSC